MRCPAGQRVTAPKRAPTPDGAFDLEGFLSELDDGKLKHLQEEVQREVRRRGWSGHSPMSARQRKPSLRRRASGRRNPPRMETSLTAGQERLVRAALAAGAIPAAVAKELRIRRAQAIRLARSMKEDRPPRD